jgi:methyltransferase family protein
MTSAIGPWDTEGDAYQQMSRLVFSYWACCTVCAVADLSIADHLADGALTAAEVAEREHTSSDTIFRLMRAAAAVGLLTQRDGRFGSTPLLRTLPSDDPRSLRPMVLCLMGN